MLVWIGQPAVLIQIQVCIGIRKPPIMGQLSIEEFLRTVQTGSRQQVEELLRQDPSLANAQSEQGVSALLQAVYYGKTDTAQLLASRRKDLSIFEAAALGDLAQVEMLLAKDKTLANAFAPDGFQPLGLAVFFNRPQVAAYLIALGADVNSPSQNAQHVHPLNSAAAAGNLVSARLLLASGAQVNTRQAGDFTPLHNAAQNGNFELVELLLHYGADPQARAANGKTPLDYAREGGHREVAERLGG